MRLDESEVSLSCFSYKVLSLNLDFILQEIVYGFSSQIVKFLNEKSKQNQNLSLEILIILNNALPRASPAKSHQPRKPRKININGN